MPHYVWDNFYFGCRFIDTGDSPAYQQIAGDHVQGEKIPEPATLCLLVFGGLAAAALLRRRG